MDYFFDDDDEKKEDDDDEEGEKGKGHKAKTTMTMNWRVKNMKQKTLKLRSNSK